MPAARITLVLLLLLAAVPAIGGIDNSHHDIRQYLPEKDACLVCHARKDSNYYGLMENDLGTFGGQCVFLCHSGKGILPETDTLVPEPGPTVNTADFTTSQTPDYTAVFFTRSHGRWPENLKSGAGRPTAWPPPGLAWPGLATGTPLECTSCHSVHDNSYPPFLLSPLAAEYPALDGFCDKCHPERATGNMSSAPDGNHPVDFVVDNAAAGLRSENGRRPRRIRIQSYGREDGGGTVNVFDVPAPAARSLNEKNVSWNMGGHLASGRTDAMTAWTPRGGRQQMGCYTCHAAHRPNINGERNLGVVRTIDAEGGWNPICVGCHGAATTLKGDREEWNVGMTPWGHPSGAKTAKDKNDLYTTSVGNFRFRIAPVSYLTRQAGNQFGTNGELLCTTCHRVHFGVAGSKGLVDIGQRGKSICKKCHSGVGIPNETDWSKGGNVTTGHNLPNSHHVTTTAPVKLSTPTLNEPHSKSNENPATKLHVQQPTWANPSTGLGDLTTSMDCPDCHVFGGTAHNW
jgi:predicted CXXCH cytochrome family protein